MKNLLLTLSSVSALTLGNGISSFVSTNDTVAPINNNMITSTQTLFSNSYQALGNSTTIITNQSTADHQYYSYDLKAFSDQQGKPIILSNGVDPKTLFTVDSNGALQYKSGAQTQIPDKDKSVVDNTKTEIEKVKQVTTIQDSKNIYSNSVYSKTYFNVGYKDWQYLQLGGVEANIDISSQFNADKVYNSQGLSESLGFYYIATAVRGHKIDTAVANSLAQYFINQSSLKTDLGTSSSDTINPLVNKIMNLLDYNDDVYNWVFNLPFYIKDKNYSLNFIFDKDNNLIEIYYNNWNKDNIVKNIGYDYSDAYNGTSSKTYLNDPSIRYIFPKPYYDPISEQNYNAVAPITLFKWSDNFKSWKDFTTVFPSFTFDSGSLLSLSVSSYTSNKTMLNTKDINTADIPDNASATRDTYFYSTSISYSSFWSSLSSNCYLWFYHDNNNLYCGFSLREESRSAQEGTHFKVHIDNCIFKNVMNN